MNVVVVALFFLYFSETPNSNTDNRNEPSREKKNCNNNKNNYWGNKLVKLDLTVNKTIDIIAISFFLSLLISFLFQLDCFFLPSIYLVFVYVSACFFLLYTRNAMQWNPIPIRIQVNNIILRLSFVALIGLNVCVCLFIYLLFARNFV